MTGDKPPRPSDLLPTPVPPAAVAVAQVAPTVEATATVHEPPAAPALPAKSQ
jgi:hypothetical protein